MMLAFVLMALASVLMMFVLVIVLPVCQTALLKPRLQIVLVLAGLEKAR